MLAWNHLPLSWLVYKMHDEEFAMENNAALIVPVACLKHF